MWDYLDAHLPLSEPVEIFAVVLVLMLAAPILMARARLPGIVGLLIAGAVLGPNGIFRAFGGLLARDDSFRLLGGVGLIYIMFTAALEVDLVVFKKYRVQGAVFGILTFILPQGLGTLVAYYVIGLPWPAAILMASMFASHTLLAYPIASRLGLGRNQAVTTAIGGTMVTDVAALLVLAVIAGMSQGEVTEAFWWRLGVSFVVFVAAIMIGLPIIGRWFFRRMAKDGPGEFVFVLTSVFICAALSEVAQLEPIIGAFLAGLALNRLIPHSGTLMNRIVFTGDAIFVPFFVLSVGMLVDVAVVFSGWRTVLIATCMLVTVTVTKFLAAHAARIAFRFSSAEGQVMFGLSVPQAAATLAVVIVGQRLGIFGDETASAEVVNGTIVMILGTCILGPLVTERFGRKVAAAEATKRAESDDEDSSESTRILVPIVDADSAKAPINLALLVRGHGSAPLYPLFVAKDGENVSARVARGEKMLAAVVGMASGADVPSHPMTRVDGSPGAAIIRARKERLISDVIAGWDGRISSEDRMFGSVLDEALTDPECTLAVAYLPHELNTTARLHFVVPRGAAEGPSFDGAGRFVKRLARALGTPLSVMALKREEKQVMARLKAVKPSTKMESKPLETWDGLLQALADRVGEHDIIALFGRRDADADDRSLPRRIVARFPERNFLTVFGETIPEPPEREPPRDDAGRVDLLPRDHIVLGLEGLVGEEVLERIYTEALANWPTDRPPTKKDLEGARREARPLGEGAVLLVHPDRQLEAPTVWLGVCREGITHSDWEGKTHLIFVAFVPEAQATSWHIDLVKALTDFTADATRRSRVIDSRSLDDCRAALDELEFPS